MLWRMGAASGLATRLLAGPDSAMYVLDGLASLVVGNSRTETNSLLRSTTVRVLSSVTVEIARGTGWNTCLSGKE